MGYLIMRKVSLVISVRVVQSSNAWIVYSVSIDTTYTT